MTTFNEIVYTVSQHRDIDVVDLLGPKRTQDISHARQEVAYIARTENGMTLADIGRWLHRDHTTVLHSINAVIKRMARSETYGAAIDEMVATIYPAMPIFKSRRISQ